MRNFNLKQLEILVAIVEYGNFTEAANQLYLAQSTVSSHVSALEEALQVPLFRRDSKKHITLTPDGKRVYQHAKEVLQKCQALENAVIGEGKKNLVIGASTTPLRGLLLQYLERFSARYPDCCCTIKSGDSEQVQQMLLDGDVQIGLSGRADNRQSLRYEKIAEDTLVLVTPNTPHYAQLLQEGVLGKELFTEPMIFRESGSGTQRMVDNYLSENGVPADKINVRFYLSDVEVILHMVEKGVGVSLQSALAVQHQVKNGTVLAFPLEENPVKRNIYMVSRKKGSLHEMAKAFVAIVRECENIEPEAEKDDE